MKYINCPFYIYHKATKICCENGRKTFENKQDKNKHLNLYCGEVHNHKLCDIAQKNYDIWRLKQNGKN